MKMKRTEQGLLDEFKSHSEADEDFAVTSIYLLELANRAHELFKVSKVDQKRQLINFVLSNLQLKGDKLLYQAKKPFDLFFEMAENLKWLLGLDSNQ